MKSLLVIGILVILGFLGFFVFSSDACLGCTPTGLVINSVSSEEFNNFLSDDVVLIDIRTPEEYNEGHIDGAINIDFYSSDFIFSISDLDRDGDYLIYCRTGSRTSQTLILMREMGFVSVRELNSGIVGWVNSGLPVVS